MPILSRFEYCTQRGPHPRVPRNGPTQKLPLMPHQALPPQRNHAAPVRRLCMRHYT
ncbi:hypothetical protein BC629DRAFT_1515377, partial [Irpex lacteus]